MPTEFARADAGRRERPTDLPPAATQTWAPKLVLATVAVVVVGRLVGEVLLVLGAGALAAVALSAATNCLMDLGVPRRGTALALVVAALAIVVGAMTWLLAPEISAQTDELMQQLLRAWQSLLTSLRHTEWGRALAHPPQVEESLAVVSNATGVLAIVLHNVALFAIVAFIGLYLAADPGPYCSGLLRLLSPPGRRRAMEVAQVVEQALQRWLLGRMLAMVIVGSVTALGLWLLSVQLALTLGLLSGLLTFIPYVGAIVSLLPSLLLAFAQGSLTAMYVVLLYVGVHVLEGYLITPLIEQKAVQLPPGLSIAAQLILWTLAGAWGLALASPIAATLLIVTNVLYIEDALDESPAASTDVGA